MKKVFFILVLLTAVLHIHQAKAVEPATFTAAAPKALELAAIWSPHAANAMQSGGIGLMKIGEATVNILCLPLGVVQCTLGAPFGYWDRGVNNCIIGGYAPFQLVYQVILLPVRLISLGAVK